MPKTPPKAKDLPGETCCVECFKELDACECHKADPLPALEKIDPSIDNYLNKWNLGDRQLVYIINKLITHITRLEEKL